MSDHTLPGDVPGLLRRGSPVVLGCGRRGVLAGSYPLGDRGQRYVVCWVEDGGSGMPSYDLDLSSVALDLTDPAGRIHALWWCRLVGLAAMQRALGAAGLRMVDWPRLDRAVRRGYDPTPGDLDTFVRVMRASVEVSRG